jgi:hypothetical protein
VALIAQIVRCLTAKSFLKEIRQMGGAVRNSSPTAVAPRSAGGRAEFETNLRRERQLEGIAKAKAAGVYKGRPASIARGRLKPKPADSFLGGFRTPAAGGSCTAVDGQAE